MVILLHCFKFTSVVYSIPTFCIAFVHVFSVQDKLNPSLSKPLLTVWLADNSCTNSLVKLQRETENLKFFILAGHATGFMDCFCGQVLMEGAGAFHRRRS